MLELLTETPSEAYHVLSLQEISQLDSYRLVEQGWRLHFQGR